MVEWLTAAKAARDVNAQKDLHPVGGRIGLLVGRGRQSGAAQLAAARPMFLLEPVGQQAVMPDAKETIRQNMLEEAVEEFFGGKGVR